VILINVLFVFLTLKPVWRSLWRWLKPFRDWFPDLNGTYNVELQHNWPVQKKMLDAAASGTQFDPRLPDAEIPPLGSAQLKARIEVGFFQIRMTMWSERPGDNGVVIDRSRTLSTSLVRPCDGHPHRLIYTYQQINQRQQIAPSDDTVFEGAAVLNIEDVESGVLRGQYWTNRAWHRGLSTAGNIILTRTGD
jgi:hypothetical protein